METESISLCQLGSDKSVLVKRENDELRVIVAIMQKYIQFTPIESVLCSSSLFNVANYIYSVSLRNCIWIYRINL